MRLTVIGPGPSFTRRPNRPSSCYLVEHAGTAIVFDLGQGSFAALGARRVPESLDALFISHLHPDHHIDLVPLRHYLRYGCRPAEQIALHPPPGLRARYDALMGEADFLDCLPGDDLEPGERTVGALHVEARPVTHVGPSFGFRIRPAADPAAPGLVYSGDVARTEDLLALVRPGDALLSEAAFGAAPNEPEAMHLDAEMAASVARDGRAAKLILTHILDEGVSGAAALARKTYWGPVLVARPGLVVEIPVES